MSIISFFKSTKIDAFDEKIWLCHYSSDKFLFLATLAFRFSVAFSITTACVEYFWIINISWEPYYVNNNAHICA